MSESDRRIDQEAWQSVIGDVRGQEKVLANTSGLKPLGHAVLVQDYMPERKGSVIVIPQSVALKESAVEQRARVIEVGPEAWAGEKMARAWPGDLVLVAKYSGHLAIGPLDDKQYRFVNDRDIFAGIIGEK